jgi:hypothetical protein
MKFPVAAFEKFCANLTIDSKERGQIRLAHLIGTQRYALARIVRSLEADRHMFVILKARQLGITTITLALDLFWHWMHPGMQGTLAADSEENRDQLRDTLSTYYRGMPGAMRIPIRHNNRTLMSFENRSRILFQIAGGKVKGKKGRGKGIIFLHGTEVALWDDQQSLESIMSSLAQKNANRFHLFESTAKGMGTPYHHMWKRAQLSNQQDAIFIGWWLNEFYRIERREHAFDVYWGAHGQPTPEEHERMRVVKLMYGYEVQPEQLAWYRFMQCEQFSEDGTIEQEFPWHEEMAWLMTGVHFFNHSELGRIKQAIEENEAPRCYRFRFTDDFVDTELDEVPEAVCHLKVWEPPDPQGYYSLGADPAYGSSTWKDRFVVSVWRCYVDRFEQVAEFCTSDITTYRFAWVMCYLAGMYRNTWINLEINGPGEAVLSELGELRRRSKTVLPTGELQHENDVRNFLAHVRYYLYSRLDSIGGSGYMYHWKTTPSSKERMVNVYRDLIEKRQARVWSAELIDEMRTVVREENGDIKGSGRAKDDRVIAAALAAEQYVRAMRWPLENMGITWGGELTRRSKREAAGGVDVPPDTTSLGKNVRTFLRRIGMEQQSMGARR